MKTLIYILRISISIIFLIVGIPSLFVEGMLLGAIFLITIAIILFPKRKIYSNKSLKLVNTNIFFEILGIYLLIDYFSKR